MNNHDLFIFHLNGLIKQLHISDEIQKIEKEIGKKRKLEDEYEETKVNPTRTKSLKLYKKGQEIESLKEKKLKLNEDLQNTRRENNFLISLVSHQNKPVLLVPESRQFLHL